jgi:hypothetical protein
VTTQNGTGRQAPWQLLPVLDGEMNVARSARLCGGFRPLRSVIRALLVSALL